MHPAPVQFLHASQVSRVGIALHMFRFSYRIAAAGIVAALLAPAGGQAADEAVAIVSGLAPGDLLNIRAAASPVGQVRTRLPNGAAVRNSGCGEFNGYQWCKVQVIDQPDISGWAPARYLMSVNPDGSTTAELPTLDEEEMKTGMPAVPAAGPGTDPAPVLPPNLAARLGDAPSAPVEGNQGEPVGLTTAELDAYRLALLSRVPAEPAGTDVALAVPQTADSDWDATGEIPCARHVGQPMERCRVEVRRSGAGKAEVLVTWPDGGTRLITFDGGKPVGADVAEDFRFTREGALNMIRIGVSERFEITDALAFGD